jgi:vacuolar-type H+-ATPase subunit I/STV1
MIDIKPPDEPFEGIEEIIKDKTDRRDEINKLMNPDAYYLKEISKTLKAILEEMRKRKV